MKLSDVIDRRGLSAPRLASLCGVTRACLWDWYYDRRLPSLDRFVTLMKVLNVDPEKVQYKKPLDIPKTALINTKPLSIEKELAQLNKEYKL